VYANHCTVLQVLHRQLSVWGRLHRAWDRRPNGRQAGAGEEDKQVNPRVNQWYHSLCGDFHYFLKKQQRFC
jgi:hypothetical protein